MVADEEFAKLLAWAYRGEVSGEALFASLAEAWAGEECSARLSVLAELERGMALELVPVLRRCKVDGGDDERSRRKGRDNAAAIAGASWADFLTQFAPVTDAALERYHRLRNIAPESDAAFDLLVAHEEALQAFGAAELSGAAARSLDPVREVIARLSADGRVPN